MAGLCKKRDRGKEQEMKITKDGPAIQLQHGGERCAVMNEDGKEP